MAQLRGLVKTTLKKSLPATGVGFYLGHPSATKELIGMIRAHLHFRLMILILTGRLMKGVKPEARGQLEGNDLCLPLLTLVRAWSRAVPTREDSRR